MIAVKHRDAVDIFSKEGANLFANDEKNIKGRSFVIFPVVAYDILKFLLFNVSAADVDSNIFILMGVLEEFLDGVYWITI